MSTNTTSFEASLLFRAPISGTPAQLADDLNIIFQAHDLDARRIDTRDPSFLLFDCGEVQVLLAACDRPLEVAHFLDAGRPSSAMMEETEILARLTAHQYSVTLLVADTPDAELAPSEDRQRLKEALCWQVAEYLNQDDAASLVFWCDSDTLYAGEEFARVSVFGMSQVSGIVAGMESLRTAEVRLDNKRDLELRALTYINAQIVQGAHRRPEPGPSFIDRVGDEIARLAPPAAAAFEMAKRNGHSMMRGATVACSAAAAGICTMPEILNAFT